MLQKQQISQLVVEVGDCNYIFFIRIIIDITFIVRQSQPNILTIVKFVVSLNLLLKQLIILHVPWGLGFEIYLRFLSLKESISEMDTDLRSLAWKKKRKKTELEFDKLCLDSLYSYLRKLIEIT